MSTQWPYASFSSASWLAGERDDRALGTVRAALSAAARTPHDADAEPLIAALAEAARIAERLDWALLALVGESRSRGLSWAAIGTALGVSRQAAQQRFGPWVAEALARATHDRGQPANLGDSGP